MLEDDDYVPDQAEAIQEDSENSEFDHEIEDEAEFFRDHLARYSDSGGEGTRKDSPSCVIRA